MTDRPMLEGKIADPLVSDGIGRPALLLGNEAIVRGALEAGVAFASGYPGTPSSEVTDTFARIAKQRGITFEYSVNEKVALELAFAASLAGARSICAMKHLGLMAAGDPISTIPYVGVRAGMVIVSAGDPSCHTSPNEQDQRHLAKMLYLPVLDPATPMEAKEMAREAFTISEKSRLPVLFRITTRVCHTRAPVRLGPLMKPFVSGFVRNPEGLNPIPVNARRMRREIPDRLAIAASQLERFLSVEGAGPLLIVTTGSPSAAIRDVVSVQRLRERVTLVSVGAVHPLAEDRLAAILDGYEEALVVEELSPFLEDALRELVSRKGLSIRILGKRTGHLPEEFEYGKAVITSGLRKAFPSLAIPEPGPVAELAAGDVPPRPPVLCASCPHRSTYYAARAAFPDDQLFFNDIGCYTLGYGGALSVSDALLCMGAGFTLAAGVSRVTGKRTVGFMGDSTFFHSGMPALLDAVKERVSMVAVILDNQVTAMTGFQDSPGVELAGGEPSRRVDIEETVRALGVRNVHRVNPRNMPEAIAAFEKTKAEEGVSVVIAQEPCPVYYAKATGTPLIRGTYRIDHTRCGTCGREEFGLRCHECLDVSQERQMARSRTLEISGRDPLPTGAGPDATAQRAEIRGLRSRATVAPCASRCPLDLCIQGYASQVAAGRYEEAFSLITSRNPLPDSVCRVCHRPCEEICVRRDLDGAVAINDLKRFVMDTAAERAFAYAPEQDEPNGFRVAVVGAGPAGLAAAHDLALRGYQVSLLDAREKPGGLLRYGIPSFRLPKEALERDLNRILGLGVSFRGGVRLGHDLDLDGLLPGGTEAHDAVFLAVGAAESIEIDLGNGVPVVSALDYLCDETISTPSRVVVVGGGNAAMDAARSARRRGATDVSVAYRRSREEMPAIPDEIDQAEREGVRLLFRMQAKEVTPRGLRCVATKPGPPDASGRPRPVPIPSTNSLRADGLRPSRESDFQSLAATSPLEAPSTEGPKPSSDLELPAELVITAVGQRPEVSLLGRYGFRKNQDQTLDLDPATCRTSRERVFAGGDVGPMGRTVTEAIAAGQRAAYGIDLLLRGRAAADRRPAPPLTWQEETVRMPHAPRRLERRLPARPPELEPAKAISGFAEVVGCLTESEARAEGARCEGCGLCGNCRACIDLFGCPAFYLQNGNVEIDPAICTGCGDCAWFCPNQAIIKAD